ncbi:GTP pyrophosphokinase family protein [Paenibacillus sp. CGMCC 1.16610]|uniref:GTP pyrophosphokinase family protein n=2 Tax=Paenibacillus TaxID=44249 RepID=A0ABU6DM60_9BACL|nr:MULTISPECIES: GTP pyrophosphokinase family protein [Paenibacillus]MBA2942879.1 GTP pyrophosphokinase family protein [Paenibacillus sp. CGMCC 1.16610]MCY9663173.1 GTP pyrophosphokinase family protein [Paenibacillus anseongense]MEB4798850.1 GTP pyrophosphokinase family protein [Paenibacillus chondroitinus]MVQ38364.1 GTP pyrophosphokinase family protein [Paenibacillus anseongense]
MMTQLSMNDLKRFKHEITRFMMTYKFALDAMETRVEILVQEFEMLHEYNPIEHTKSRLKSPESIFHKLSRKGGDMSFDGIKACVKDIAGMRITCSFVSDIYAISNMLKNQSDLKVLGEKDYIKHPKPNGYQSLHLLVEVPVHLTDRQESVCIEIQIRTIAMDFWASLEHKIFYKFNEGNQAVPARLLEELRQAAMAASALDLQMERLHAEIEEIKEEQTSDILASDALNKIVINNQQFALPQALLELLSDDDGK